MEVVTKVLQYKEDCSEEVAGENAERVYPDYGSNDIRDAIRISRLADAYEEIHRVIESLERKRGTS